jgi:hypothetical protein
LSHHQPFQVPGFHSCDKKVGMAVLKGDEVLKPSNNSWDWLGGGIYFWEQNPDRALEYATESASGKQYNKIRIKTPFIIGCTIELHNCLNLIEPESLSVIEDAYKGLKKLTKREGHLMPKNVGSKRELDCAVMKYVHTIREESNLPPYDTIRCAFQEGKKIYPTAPFTTRVHIQVCVINPKCLRGFYLPLPHEIHNPYLNKEYP